MSEKEKIYTVYVDTGGSSHTFRTNTPNVMHNFMRGNEPMVRFMTIEGHDVAVPGRYLIMQSEEKLDDGISF